MTNFLLGFFAGLCVGAIIGVLCIALVSANRTPDNDKPPIDYEERDGDE